LALAPDCLEYYISSGYSAQSITITN